MTTWFVSSSHRVPAGPSEDRTVAPFGTRHARRPGDTTTACGRAALGWPMFWLSEFVGTGENDCAACSAAVERHDLRASLGW